MLFYLVESEMFLYLVEINMVERYKFEFDLLCPKKKTGP